MAFLAVLLAALSGCCGSLAAISISWTAHVARGQPLSFWQHCLSLVCNLSMTGLQVSLGFIATRFGPVAVVMPLSVGAALLSNMILQVSLRLAKFTNASITGTLILVVAILMLTELGPHTPKNVAPPLELLRAPQAIVFIAITLFVCFGCLAALLSGRVTKNFCLLVLFALVGGAGTVLNMSIQKMLMSDPPAAVGFTLLGAWLALSCLCLWSGAYANASLKDPSLFVPINNAVNLCLNCLAGLLIWGDLDHLEYPWCYLMVYVQVGLGSYLVSSVDVFSLIHLQIVAQMARQIPALSKRMSIIRKRYKIPEVVQFAAKVNSALLKEPTHELLETTFEHSFPSLHAAIGLLQASDRDDFEKRLVREIRYNMIRPQDVARLCADLLERTGGIHENESLVAWVSTITADVERDRLRGAFSRSASHLSDLLFSQSGSWRSASDFDGSCRTRHSDFGGSGRLSSVDAAPRHFPTEARHSAHVDAARPLLSVEGSATEHLPPVKEDKNSFDAYP